MEIVQRVGERPDELDRQRRQRRDRRRGRGGQASFFWRARSTNPILSWYLKNADGVARFPEWHVFWRGLSIDQIDPAIRYALAAPADFVS